MVRSVSWTEKKRREEEEVESMQNYISEPNSPREKQMLQNPRFAGSIYRMKRAMKERDMLDNVYAEVKPRHYFISMRGAPNAST